MKLADEGLAEAAVLSGTWATPFQWAGPTRRTGITKLDRPELQSVSGWWQQSAVSHERDLPPGSAGIGDTDGMPLPDKYDLELRRRRTAGGENRLPPAIAVVIAVAAYALMPDTLLVGPRFIIPVIEVVLLIALVLTNPRRIVTETRWSRGASIGLAGIIIATNLVALVLLITTLNKSSTAGTSLLIGGMQVWFTNVIGFGLLYWELDRGGPVPRHTLDRRRLQPADWRFSQDENDDAVVEVAASASATSGWVPTCIDYLYLSLTNSSAFSPTDTMPLSSRAKLLMGIEVTAALMTSLLVVARAVGALGGG